MWLRMQTEDQNQTESKRDRLFIPYEFLIVSLARGFKLLMAMSPKQHPCEILYLAL